MDAVAVAGRVAFQDVAAVAAGTGVHEEDDFVGVELVLKLVCGIVVGFCFFDDLELGEVVSCADGAKGNVPLLASADTFPFRITIL